MRKIYVILVEYCMKLTLLTTLKGDNYYKHVERAYNFRVKLGIGKWYIGGEVHFFVNFLFIQFQKFKPQHNAYY